MSQSQYITTLERQINSLNQRIDQKIMSGQKYLDEARKHRMLLRKIQSQRVEQRKSIISRMFPLFA
ncbi:MAG: hypothetical protein V4478_01075 [Patescibacteria group bacterium]